VSAIKNIYCSLKTSLMGLLVWLDSWVGYWARTAAICQLRNSCRYCCSIHQVYFATSKKLNYSIYK